MPFDPFGLIAEQLGGSAGSPRIIASMSRLQRLQLLQRFERDASAGRPVDPLVLEWFACAARMLLSTGGRLDEHLGIASRRRGTAQAPHKLLALHERDAAIAAVFKAAPGTHQREKSEATVRIIHGQAKSFDGSTRRALETLFHLRPGVALPSSGRQIVRIVHAQAAKYPRQG